MIKATGTTGTGFTIETAEKINGQSQRLHVPTEEDCLRIAYFWNRLYIYEKMSGFLKQRIYALNLASFHTLASSAGDLLYKVELCRLSSFNTLCEVVATNAATIELIAPGEQSSHYHFYGTTIKSVVQFCTEIHAGAKLRLFPDVKGEPVI